MSDLVDVMIRRFGQSCRERDQARDALVDLLLALDDPGPHRALLTYTPALVSAMQQARTVLRQDIPTEARLQGGKQ